MDNFEELVKAFKKEEMKTKHAQRKAEKEKLKRTRSVKQGIVNSRDMVVRGLKQEIKRDFKRFKRNHAADSNLISYIKKLESQVNQVMS
tara:strand:- start:777 stop:1043 length:267 start_codon:yes stop_codon:yes gene_type:complete